MPRIINWKVPPGYRQKPSFDTAPRIYSLSPTIARAGVATAVTILGANFRNCPKGDPPTVKFGGLLATSVVVVNSGTITCNTPVGEGEGVVDVEITVGCCQ